MEKATPPEETGNWQYAKINYPFAQSQQTSPTRTRPAAAPKIAGKTTAGDVAWQIGDRIQHKNWGQGTVVKVNGQGEDAELDVAFKQEGIKRLLAEFAPIKKI